MSQSKEILGVRKHEIWFCRNGAIAFITRASTSMAAYKYPLGGTVLASGRTYKYQWLRSGLCYKDQVNQFDLIRKAEEW